MSQQDKLKKTQRQRGIKYKFYNKIKLKMQNEKPANVKHQNIPPPLIAHLLYFMEDT